MSIEQILENEVYGTESGKKLVEMLSNLQKDKNGIEQLVVLLETEENRQKMINFLEKGNTDLDEIVYYVSDLRNKGDLYT